MQEVSLLLQTGFLGFFGVIGIELDTSRRLRVSVDDKWVVVNFRYGQPAPFTELTVRYHNLKSYDPVAANIVAMELCREMR